MLVFRSAITEFDEKDVLPSPHCEGADFICGAVQAAKEAPLKVRKTVQCDIATALDCQEDSLSFLWAHPIKGAEVLDCEIPDFRDAMLRPIAFDLVAE